MTIFYASPDKLESVLPPQGVQFINEFLAAAREFWFPVELIASICWRESHFGEALMPPGPAGTGDNGHGRGLMQVDDRSHSDWLALVDGAGRPLWQSARENIRKGAAILTTMRHALPGAHFSAWVAAYNAGPGRVAAVLRTSGNVDRVTTGGDYSADVVNTARIWHALIKNGGECDCFLCKP